MLLCITLATAAAFEKEVLYTGGYRLFIMKSQMQGAELFVQQLVCPGRDHDNRCSLNAIHRFNDLTYLKPQLRLENSSSKLILLVKLYCN